jgi:hypothetical protein
MKVTKQEKELIENYLDYYYQKFQSSESQQDPLSFRNQMHLLFHHLTEIKK